MFLKNKKDNIFSYINLENNNKYFYKKDLISTHINKNTINNIKLDINDLSVYMNKSINKIRKYILIFMKVVLLDTKLEKLKIKHI